MSHNFNPRKLIAVFVVLFVGALVCVGIITVKEWIYGRNQRIRQEAITYRESLGFVGRNGGRLIAVGPFGQIESAESCRFYMNEEGFGPFIADTNMIREFDRLRRENDRAEKEIIRLNEHWKQAVETFAENTLLKKRVEELEKPPNYGWQGIGTTNYTITQDGLRNIIESAYPPPGFHTVLSPGFDTP